MQERNWIASPAMRAALGVFFLALFAWTPARAVEVQRVVSPGGIEAWLVEDHSNPIVSLDLAFRGGSVADPQGQDGLANMVASLIDEGAGELDSQAFQGVLEDHSITLRFNTGTDNFNGAMVTLTENRDLAFKMLRLALSAPRFDAEPVERIRAQILAGLARAAEDPDSIAYRTLRSLQFPAHPYGRDSDGTIETVTAITPAQMRGFVARRFARDNLILGVVGDIAPAELAALLDETFGVLPASAEPVEVAETRPQGGGALIVIERDQPQSIVAFGQGGIKRDDPDYYAAYVVNHILGGGGFSSRLYTEVREKRGLAYSIYAYLHPLEHAALVIGGVATQNSRVATTLELVREEWRRMAEDGPSAEELDAAKTFLTGSYPLRFSNSGQIANMLVGIQIENLGIDYMDRRNGFIEAVTLDDARRVARRLYDADALSVVVVGHPEGVVANREAPRS